jgi:hypothetical protein
MTGFPCGAHDVDLATQYMRSALAKSGTIPDARPRSEAKTHGP